MKEARELCWSMHLAALQSGLDQSDMISVAKSADWKVALATVMKQETTVSNPWLAAQLGIGAPSVVSRLVIECVAAKRAVALCGKITSKR